MSLSLFTNFISTTNFTNDTAVFNYTTSGAPLTGPPDYTAPCVNYVPPPWNNVNNFYTSPVFTSAWTISGTGGTGEVLGIYFTLSAQYGPNDETNDRKTIFFILNTGGGTFTGGLPYTLSPPLPCFVTGTRILTQNGYKAIETLLQKDFVVLSDGRRVHYSLKKIDVGMTNTQTAPYRIEAGAFGNNKPESDMCVSPTHKIQLRKGVWISPQRAALTNPKVKQYGIGEPVTYWHIACADYLRDNIIAEGMIVESLATSKNYNGPDKVYTWSNRLGGFTRVSPDTNRLIKQ
jgi:hypothetical protein